MNNTNNFWGMPGILECKNVNELWYNNEFVGYTRDWGEETYNKGLHFKQLCLDNHLIEPELTAEEKLQAVIEKQNEVIAQYAAAGEKLLARIEELEKNVRTSKRDDNVSSDECVEQGVTSSKRNKQQRPPSDAKSD